MASSHLQGMSPKPTTALEGEVSGPNYGATFTTPPGLPRPEQQPAGPDVVMNGAPEDPLGIIESREPLELQSRAPDSALSEDPPAPHTLEPVLPELPGVQGRGLESVSDEPGAAFVQTQQRVEVGGFEVSPPDELPSGQQSPGSGNQAVWFVRLQEFVQKRMSQASAAVMTPIMEARQRTPTQVTSSGTPRPPRLS